MLLKYYNEFEDGNFFNQNSTMDISLLDLYNISFDVNPIKLEENRGNNPGEDNNNKNICNQKKEYDDIE